MTVTELTLRGSSIFFLVFFLSFFFSIIPYFFTSLRYYLFWKPSKPQVLSLSYCGVISFSFSLIHPVCFSTRMRRPFRGASIPRVQSTKENISAFNAVYCAALLRSWKVYFSLPQVCLQGQWNTGFNLDSRVHHSILQDLNKHARLPVGLCRVWTSWINQTFWPKYRRLCFGLEFMSVKLASS